MADTEAPAEGTEPQPEVSAKGPSRLILIGAIAGTLIVGAAVGFLVVGPMVAGPATAEAADSTSHAGASAEGEHAPASENGAAESLHVIDNMVLNPAQSNGSRFLLVATAIEFTDPALVEQVKARDAEARDVLISVLGARTVEELADLAQRDSIKSQIASAFNEMLRKPKGVRRVYFPQFVVQ